MKKLFLALAAAVCLFTACQKEEPTAEEIAVNLSFGIDQAETRALATGPQSDKGGISNIDPGSDYVLRYILEIYEGETFIDGKRFVAQSPDFRNVTIPVRLLPGNYNFVVFADIVKANTNLADYHYYTVDGLDEITINDDWTINDDTRDMYFVNASVEIAPNKPVERITLTRPFGKLRVVTTDLEFVHKKPAQVTVSYSAPNANGFNAVTGKIITDPMSEKCFTANIITYSNEDNKTTTTLFTDYIFVDATSVVKFDLTAIDESGAEISTYNFNTDIPVKRNALTTIIGNVLTLGKDINITVDDNLGGTTENPNTDITVINSVEDFQAAVNAGGNYIITSNLYFGAPAQSNAPALTRAAVEPKTTTIDLNGFTITFSNPTQGTSLVTVPAGATLSLIGEGALVPADDNNGSFIATAAEDDQNGKEEAQVNIAGAVVVEDGVFHADANFTDYRTELAAAFAAGGEYALQANITINSTLELAEKENLTLDLNGYTLRTAFAENSTTNHIYAIDNKGILTIKDTKGNGEIIARGIFNYGTMTLESGKINACDANGGYGVRNYEGAKFTMNGGEIVTSFEDGDAPGNGYDATTLRVDEGATATILGGVINNISNFTFALDNLGTVEVSGGEITSIHSTVSNSGKVTISGGSFTCNGLEGVTAHALVAWDGSVTNITGGTFDGKDNYNGFNVDAGKGAVVNISGGNFLQVHSGSLYGEGTINVTGGTFFDNPETRVLGGCFIVENEDGTYTVTDKGPVSIEETYYNGINEAFAAVKDGETITLNRNFVFTKDNYYDNGGWRDGGGYAGDKSFTIDLNGYTISQNGDLNDYLFWFKNSGSKANTITIKNGTLDAGTTAFCALCTASSHDNQLTVNTENVNLINNNQNGSTVKIRTGSVYNAKAGTKITGKNSYLGIENWKATVNIYDGAEIYMNGTSSYNGCLVGVGGNGTINIYGGKGLGVSGGIIAMTSGGTINVSGGEWIANTDGTCANSNKSVLIAQSDKQYNAGAGNAVVNVTGGTFKGGYNCYGNKVGDAQINISGGNFNANPSTYLAEGYAAVENNGIWTIVEVITVSDEATLKSAFNNGGYVKLSNDITIAETAILEAGNVTLDLNGKTVTATAVDAFQVKTGAKLTLKNGTVSSHGAVIRATGGEAIIESGTFTQTGTAVGSIPETYRYAVDAREGGKITINGGEFTSGNGMFNVGSEIVVNGGKFTNLVEKTMTRHFAYVSAKFTINGGEFLGKANSGAGGCFFCGAAAGGDIQVNGGKFTSLWTSGSVNRIFEVYFGGTINVTGGMFNTNGGITSFVTENTDATTKNDYPYVAK